ncbi:MAG: Stk1 family PASTA domain-containing Ser/Thr kinase [Clostridiales bacterium]|jgi:serine/threonine-protein kinase|nr:Stk1 family PASTA domain-containing Ser/Thr kinase [Clostridiales bacterium]
MILSPGQIISNTYEIIEKIGSGGMSIVYKAKHIKLNRYVTLKVMREEHMSDDEFLERFRIEARAVASLSHPNIVGVYDVVTDGRVNYIVMEYVDGLTLKNLIAKRAPFSNDEILGVAIQINDALTHAHQNGIVHRDIKPQNILVTKQGLIKVTDFGIARTADTNTLSAKDQTMGSVHYFSPEQAKGGFVDAKSDMYSLGILMYEMATSELPFDGDSPVSVALMQVNEPLPDIRSKNPEISEDVDSIIRRLTDKLAKRRYPSDGELSDALKAAIAAPAERGRDRLQNTLSISGVEFERLQQEIRRDNELSDDYEYEGDDYGDDFDEYDEDERKADHRIIIAAIAAAALVVVVIAFILWPRTPADTSVAMPRIEGMRYEDAVELLKGMGFELSVNQELYSEEVPKGLVITQNYSSGARLIPGASYTGDRAIKVNVSLGPTTFDAPNLVGIDIAAARERFAPFAQTSGCALSIEVVADPDAPKDQVVSQYPEAGEPLKWGAALTVYVSAGKTATVFAPKVTGLSEDEARKKLIDFKLTPGRADYRASDMYESGVVMSQSVNPGRETPEGTVVDIVVSTGQSAASASPPPSGEPTTPSPTPEPTESEPPTPSPTPRERTIRVMIDVGAGTFLNEDESAAVAVYRRSGGNLVQLWTGTAMAADFPINPEVTGSGTQEIVVFINGTEVGSQMVSFGS